jgi:predicted nucleic acid-binding protein
MAAVVDSGPIILLSAIGQLHLLRERFAEILITPQIEREVVTEGQVALAKASCRTRSRPAGRGCRR